MYSPPMSSRRSFVRTILTASFATLTGCTTDTTSVTNTTIDASPTDRPPTAITNTVTTSATPTPTTSPTESNRVKWSIDLKEGIATDLILNDESLYLVAGNTLYQVNTVEKDAHWSFALSMSPASSLAYKDGIVFVSESHRLGAPPASIYAVESSDGTDQWTAEIGRRGGTPPTVSEGAVYVGGDAIYALETGTGAQKWRFPTDSDEGFEAAVAVDGDTIFVGDAANGGTMYAIDTNSGQLTWKVSVSTEIASRAAITAETVYFGTVGKTVYALNRATRQIRWSTRLDDHVFEGPIVDETTVYVNGGQYLYGLDATTGEKRWKSVKGDNFATPVLDQGIIYVGTDGGVLYAISAISGEIQWAFETEHGIVGAPVVSSSTIYVGDTGGGVYALHRDLA